MPRQDDVMVSSRVKDKKTDEAWDRRASWVSQIGKKRCASDRSSCLGPGLEMIEETSGRRWGWSSKREGGGEGKAREKVS